MRWPWQRQHTQDEAQEDRDDAMDELDERIMEAERKLEDTREVHHEISRAAAKARHAQSRADAFTRALERTYRPPRREA